MLSAIAVFLYPFGVWYGFSVGGIEWLVWIFVLIFSLRLLTLCLLQKQKGSIKNLAWMGYALLFCALALCVTSVFLKSYHLLLYYPVAVNLILLCVFGGSLRSSMPVVERLARLREPDLSKTAICYTYRVTQIWCVFFILNGSIALWTCVYGDMKVWTLYNGFISYVCIGLLGAGEWLVRKRVQRRENLHKES